MFLIRFKFSVPKGVSLAVEALILHIKEKGSIPLLPRLHILIFSNFKLFKNLTSKIILLKLSASYLKNKNNTLKYLVLIAL